MAEREVVKLPEENRTGNFYASFTLKEDDEKITVNEGYIYAPRRGNEIMAIIKNFFKNLARSKKKKVIHQFEASSLPGKKLVQKNEEYKHTGRSSGGNSTYEAEYDP